MSGELAKALVAAQKEMPHIALDGVNPHFRSKFATLGQIIDKTRPVLAKHGLSIVQLPTQVDGVPALRTILMHQGGEQVEDTMLLLPGKSDPQGQGAALTYARRYAWSSVLGLAADEDDDGNSAQPSSYREAAVQQAVTVATTNEAPPASSNGAGLDTVVGFGKHKGKTIGQLLDSERGYVEWLANSFDAKSAATLQVKQAAVAAISGGGGNPDDDIPF